MHNRRARNMSIRISPRGEIRVTVPGLVSQRKAERFVASRREWIQRKVEEVRDRQASVRRLQEGDCLNVRGKEIAVLFHGPDESMEDAIWRILLEEAREYLPVRTRELAQTHGFRITGVKVRKMQTRWGSCSAKNAINLNTWLMMLPDHLSDYVILHELVHTLHKDHSPRFWRTLDQYTDGSSRELRKELRTQQIMSVYAE